MKYYLYYIRKNVIIIIFHPPCRCRGRREGFDFFADFFEF